MLDKIETIFLFLTCVCLSLSWETYFSRPKLYGNAIRKKDLNPQHLNVRNKIVVLHNFYRSRVDPPASDMLEMTWNQDAAADAQRWAEDCQLLTHDNATGRWVDDYGSCGQNIFVANVQIPWSFAIKIWYMEHLNFTFNGTRNNSSLVGHYTQMVWYSSHRIGCGFHYCGRDDVKKPFYNYICNYCPIGNHPERFSKPYTKGTPCSNCRGHCKYKKLCTNSCTHADLWMNCGALNRTWNQWLCGNKNEERYHACQSTCTCNGKIR